MLIISLIILNILLIIYGLMKYNDIFTRHKEAFSEDDEIKPYPTLDVLEGFNNSGSFAINNLQISWGDSDCGTSTLLKKREFVEPPIACILTPSKGFSDEKFGHKTLNYNNLTKDGVDIHCSYKEKPVKYIVFGKCKEI